jgi:hypothetical protein
VRSTIRPLSQLRLSPALLLIGIAVVGGAARGLFTLEGATLVSDHWGPERYAALNGVFHAPMGVAAAIAPGFGAGIAAITSSYTGLFAILTVGAGDGAAALAAASGDPSALSWDAELVE